MKRVERVITVSEFSKRQAVNELGVPEERIAVVHDGVDSRFVGGPKPRRLVERFGLQGKSVVLFVGGLKERKNLFLLLDVWREVVNRHDARLVVVGSGPLLESLQGHARRLAIEGLIHFAGYVPEAEKVDYYNVADLLAVAEAMACELPVVVSNRGALPELIAHGDGGFLCDPTNAGDFARAIAELLVDARLRAKFGAANAVRVEARFRWERTAEAVKRIYEEVLRDWRRARAQAR